MTSPPDQFAILGQPRRPWLPADELKETFHRASATSHPDKTGKTDTAAALNAAFATLCDPSARLRHLLELEHPDALTQKTAVPQAMADIFLRMATLRRAVDAFVDQQTCASTALGQALLASDRFALQHDVEKQLHVLNTAHARCLEHLQALDAEWPTRTPHTIAAAAALQQELSYLSKWSWQLREVLFRLNP